MPKGSACDQNTLTYLWWNMEKMKTVTTPAYSEFQSGFAAKLTKLVA